MPRRPRVDAARNRGAILSAARDQITAHGPDVGMDEIAAFAGVAVGTLYRHFETKSALVAAVLDEYLVAISNEAEEAAARVHEGASAGDEIAKFIRNMVDVSAANRAAKAVAISLGVSPDTKEVEVRTVRAITKILKAGFSDGSIPKGVTFEDVYLVVQTAPYEQPRASRERWLNIILKGLLSSVAPGDKKKARSTT
jgi:AcrR family transcriptional regulator